ncbi:MAG: T9SS type A sorting domain-containing protein [Bacteroidetes bacterium]|nr:T9SS type A sorting domain-containing protein [Bacteroidota bacterium]
MKEKNLQHQKGKGWLGLGLGLLMCCSSVSTKAQCIASSNSPTGTISISPYVQTLISNNMLPGSYAIINITNAGEYGIGTSFGSFVTITDNANVVVGSGNNTLYLNFPTAGLYRIHLHSTNACSTSGGTRIVAVSPRNNCFSFDGTNDYINLGTTINSVLAPLNKITAEAWVYPTSTVSNGVIIGNYSTPLNQMQFCLRRSGTVYQFFVGNGSVGNYINANSAATVTTNIWQHVAGTWDGAVVRIYVNGVLSGTASVTYPAFNGTTNNIWIGSNGAAGGEVFAGSIDEARIWTRAVCQSEIQNNMNGAIPTTATGLLANYHFNQGVAGATNATVTSLMDDSGNSYNGTVINAALTGTISNWMGSTAFGDGAAAPAFISPTVAVTGGTVICSGNSVVLTANGNVTSYNWVSGPGTFINVVSPSVTSTYSVTGTNSVGCISNMAMHTVSVNATPTVSANSGTICAGNAFTITPSGASTFTIQGGSAVVSPTAAASYTVKGTSAAGCVSANTATSNITVNTTPTVTANSGTICSGNAFTITPGGASTFTIQGGSAVVSPTAAASYTVMGTSAAGCVSANTATSNLTVNGLPTVSAATSSSLICSSPQQTATLTASGATTYTWSNSTNGAVIAVSPSVTASYTVTGTDANGCVNSAMVTQSVSNCTGIHNFGASDQGVKLYPNPNNGVFTLEIANVNSATVMITDVSGRIVLSETVSNESTQMNIQSLQNGIYFINVNNNNSKQVIKFIKD